MNLIPRPVADWFRPLKPFFRRYLAIGVEATAREDVAQFGVYVIKAQRELHAVASEGLDIAERLGDKGEHHKELSKLLADGILETVRICSQVTSLEMSPTEGREAVAESFFSEGSGPTEIGSSPQNGAMAAIEDRSRPEPEAPVPPKRRGRPKGSKTRAAVEAGPAKEEPSPPGPSPRRGRPKGPESLPESEGSQARPG